MLQKNSQDMRLQENHGLQNSPWGGGKPYLASGLYYSFLRNLGQTDTDAENDGDKKTSSKKMVFSGFC